MTRHLDRQTDRRFIDLQEKFAERGRIKVQWGGMQGLKTKQYKAIYKNVS